MTEGIIIALITGLCAVIGQYFISRKNRIEDAIERAKLDERTDQRLKIIENKLDEHNHYAMKFDIIQDDIALIKTELVIMKKEEEWERGLKQQASER